MTNTIRRTRVDYSDEHLCAVCKSIIIYPGSIAYVYTMPDGSESLDHCSEQCAKIAKASK